MSRNRVIEPISMSKLTRQEETYGHEKDKRSRVLKRRMNSFVESIRVRKIASCIEKRVRVPSSSKNEHIALEIVVPQKLGERVATNYRREK